MLLETPESRVSSSDRFIPRRTTTSPDLSYYSIGEPNDANNYINLQNYTDRVWFVNTAKMYYNLEHYRSELRKTMLPEMDRVLVFSSPKKKVKYHNTKDVKSRNLWPIHPRSKPLLGPPSLILDMPDLDTNISHQVVDWGKKGYIATVYENEVHLWHPDDALSTHVTTTVRRVQSCLKWNADGSQFAVALEMSGIAAYDCKTCKLTCYSRCRCCFNRCVVTAMEWTSDDHLITGCSFGNLCVWSKHLQYVRNVDVAHSQEIINIKISCDERYLVTSGVDKRVRIWKWPSLAGLIDIVFPERPIKALSWHPWKGSLLAIGGPTTTDLWNVNTLKQLESKNHPRENSIVDSLTFNPLSAELVVSYYSLVDEGVHFLSVLKDLEHIIDEAQFHIGRVPYLLWDATGTKLATASADENLCIWDFFGTSTETEKKYLAMSKKKKLSTNMFKNLNIFNSYIR